MKFCAVFLAVLVLAVLSPGGSAEQARDALVAAGGPEYEVGNSADVLYTASGASDDYVYSEGVPYAYTVELTGGGLEGFDLPASELSKVASDTFVLFKVFGQYAGTLTVS
ncbi:carboxypeptidase B-like [Anopheles cruzii]|uniref:carboxypeptidase B-like n=1 Tax=Anopheles cruzii TaxID=68878 RepID=UPI0022EC7DA9|nr:carboxypeptidase B-like [Anopheles cruzii]